jgi:hypothetical protein
MGALDDLSLTLDPLTQNRYALTGANPVSFVEIDGHFGWDDVTDAVSDAADFVADHAHEALDACGLVPVVGSACDVANAGIYAAEGDWGNAAISAVGALPGIGEAATVAKYALKYGDEAVAGARMLASKGDEAAAAARTSFRGSTPDVHPLKARADELHGNLRGIANDRKTTAAVRAETPDGQSRIIIGSSDDRVPAVQRRQMRPDEIEATGPGHAEVTAMREARRQGWKPREVAASRDICSICRREIRHPRNDASAVSRFKRYRFSRYAAFRFF